VDACGRGGGGQRYVDVHTENYSPLTSSSSHAKKLAFFGTRISFLDGIKSGNSLST